MGCPGRSLSIIASPCAACKFLRRKCSDKCLLAPYFPPTDPLKFTIAHRVFGASNIIKFLQELPETQRADAVSSMVYEASARIRDPVYGCAGAICHLQSQINELQAQLAKANAEHARLFTLLSNYTSAPASSSFTDHSVDSYINPQAACEPLPPFVSDQDNSSLWPDSLWVYDDE